MRKADVDMFMSDADADANGQVDYSEFTNALSGTSSPRALSKPAASANGSSADAAAAIAIAEGYEREIKDLRARLELETLRSAMATSISALSGPNVRCFNVSSGRRSGGGAGASDSGGVVPSVLRRLVGQSKKFLPLSLGTAPGDLRNRDAHAVLRVGIEFDRARAFLRHACARKGTCIAHSGANMHVPLRAHTYQGQCNWLQCWRASVRAFGCVRRCAVADVDGGCDEASGAGGEAGVFTSVAGAIWCTRLHCGISLQSQTRHPW